LETWSEGHADCQGTRRCKITESGQNGLRKHAKRGGRNYFKSKKETVGLVTWGGGKKHPILTTGRGRNRGNHFA